MRYVRSSAVSSVGLRVITRIGSSTKVTQILRLMVLGLGQPRVIIGIRHNVRSQLIEDPSLTTKAVHKVVHKYNKSGTQSHHRVL